MLDQLKPKIDDTYINSFPFPAVFEDQRYIGDKGSVQWIHSDGVNHEEGEIIVIKDEYIKHFGF